MKDIRRGGGVCKMRAKNLVRTSWVGEPKGLVIALYVTRFIGFPGRMWPDVPMEVLLVLSPQAQASKTLPAIMYVFDKMK
jgi:hypothetical protein